MSEIRGWGVRAPGGELLRLHPMRTERAAAGEAATQNAADEIEDDAAERYRAVRVVLREEG